MSVLQRQLACQNRYGRAEKGLDIVHSTVCGSKFFPLRVDPFLESYVLQGSKQGVTKVVSLC